MLKRLFGLNKSTEKTRETFFGKLRGVFQQAKAIDDDLWDELEAILIGADVGVHRRTS